MSAYTDIVRQWATDIRRTGIIADADGTGEVGLDRTEKGNKLAARFTLKVEMDRVADIRYQVFGCGFSMAACAVAADISVGYTLEEVQNITASRIDRELEGLPSDRAYCAELAAEALRAAVESVRQGRLTIHGSLELDKAHGPRVSADDPVYTLLMSSAKPVGVDEKDRHLFSCLLAVTSREAGNAATATGLVKQDLVMLLDKFFPAVKISTLYRNVHFTEDPSRDNGDAILSVLLNHLPEASEGCDRQVSTWLCHAIAARSSRPGHLWVAMGLFERPELSAAIHRHLPSLAAANSCNMRWKRFLFKELCDRDGGTMCKAPNCGVCSDYAICFAEGGS